MKVKFVAAEWEFEEVKACCKEMKEVARDEAMLEEWLLESPAFKYCPFCGTWIDVIKK